MRRRVGVIVNPIAGMGGRVGLKGTDGAETLAEALRRGATPVSEARAIMALRELARIDLEVFAGAGALGEQACLAAGLSPRPVSSAGLGAERTRSAACAMAGVDLLIFAGGDGTARDILASIGSSTALLGIPTGVKMQSAVFGTSPAAAGRVAAQFLRAPGALREAEIMDLDEDALRQGRVSPRLHGFARVPEERVLMQACKAGAAVPDDTALDALARRIVGELQPGRLYLLGCGTTTRRIKRALGFEGTLMGVDVVRDRRMLLADAQEAQLLNLLEAAPATAILGVTGGQGFLLGRGNQQFSPEVLRRLGRENLLVVAGAHKLALLDPACLHVDTGDAALDAELGGYIAIRTAPDRSAMLRIAA